jgi:hypothetical protein
MKVAVAMRSLSAGRVRFAARCIGWALLAATTLSAAQTLDIEAGNAHMRKVLPAAFAPSQEGSAWARAEIDKEKARLAPLQPSSMA